MSHSPDLEIAIRPNSSWVRVDWRGLWEYRDLLLLLVRRDFISRYKQTILGPAWFVLQPVLMTLTFTVVFGRIARIPTGDAPPVLFYLCGLLGWTYFSQNFQSTSMALINHASLFKKVYFPRLIIPISAVVSNLLAFGIQLVTFLAVYIYYKQCAPDGGRFGVEWTVCMLPLIVLHIALFSLGVGLWFSALSAKYRDFQHLSAFLVQIWMYATPVIYPFSSIPDKWRWVFAFNPMTMPVEMMKQALLGAGFHDLNYLAVSIAGTLLTLVSGLLVFQRVERTFADIA